jgi:hypothetical protein
MTDSTPLKIDNIEKKWAPFAQLMPLEVMASKVSTVIPFLNEPIYGVVPSVHLLPDGPAVSSLYVFSMRVMARTFIGSDDETWDFMYRYRIERLRWNFQNIEGQSNSGTIAYKVATVEGQGGRHVSFNLSFVGTEPERAAWIELTREMIPTNVVLFV